MIDVLPWKILLVDDEPDILEFLKYNLVKEGYKIFTAPDGLKGIEIARSVQPDLIVLDIMMPELDGVQTCKMLRAIPEFAQTLIVFLTAREEDYLQVGAFENGADDYITKPIRPKVFLSRIQAQLRRLARTNSPTESKSEVLTFDNLEINRERRMILLAGKEISLPRKEFDILWFLASKPGKVYTREEIFESVWGEDVIVGTRTIDVHIRKLRENIGENYIKTFKGVGYKFEF